MLAALILTIIGTRPAFAKITRGPYLQNITGSGAAILWETADHERGMVRYGLAGNLSHAAYHVGLSSHHEIRLSALLPDTLYYYRVISGTDSSTVSSFHTPVRPGRFFRFLAYGDNRTDVSAHKSVVEQMLAVRDPYPSFLINSGDLTAAGKDEEYQTFFEIEKPLLCRAPVYPCPGNHDLADTTNYHRVLSLPNNERWYSFRYGNSSFHVLDLYSPYEPGSAQHTWFVRELMADSADVTVRHVFALFHAPPYSTNGGHGSDMKARAVISPLLERFQVRLTFQGHNHCYERSLANGVNYITTGGGGAPLYDKWSEAEAWTRSRAATLEFVQVDVWGDTVNVRTIRPGGAVIDSLLIVEDRKPAAGGPARADAPVPGDAPDGNTRPSALEVLPDVVQGTAQILFRLDAPSWGILRVCDPTGETVTTLVNAQLHPNRHVFFLETGALKPGAYAAVLHTDNGDQTARFFVIR
jgi:acid phosphatase type 7